MSAWFWLFELPTQTVMTAAAKAAVALRDSVFSQVSNQCSDFKTP